MSLPLLLFADLCGSWKGWLLDLAPENWDSVNPDLLSGSAMTAAYEAKMAADVFEGCA